MSKRGEDLTRLDLITVALCVSGKLQGLTTILTGEMARAGQLTVEQYETNIVALAVSEARALVAAARVIETELDKP